MKIQIASDLHLESYALRNASAEGDFVYRSATDARGHPRVMGKGGGGVYPPHDDFAPVEDRDLLVLAGDIGPDALALDFVERELTVSPVVYVPGNHEYYSRRAREAIDAGWRTQASVHEGLHYLVAESVEIDGVTFWGAPWYSDLWGITPHERTGAWYHRDVASAIHDFHPHWGGAEAWTVASHIDAHHAQTRLLREFAGKLDVVITHWPPTAGAIHPKFDGDELNPYFINDHPELVREIGAKLWISGHTHEAYDYEIGGTRCIGNPTGFSAEHRESRLFRPDKVVRV